MKDSKIMELDGVVDPYTEKNLPKGRRVKCYTTVNGVTMCRTDKDKYWAIIILGIIGMILLVLLFSIKITITQT